MKFKNSVVVTGVVTDIDLRIESYNDKKTNEPYRAIVGSYSLNSGPIPGTTDEEGKDNVISLRVFFKEFFNSGKTNSNFTIGSRWIDDPESAIGTRVSTSTSISQNAFIPQGTSEVVASTSIQAGFFNTRSIGNDKSEFSVDLLIKTDLVEEFDRDENPTGRYIVNGEIADFSGMVFPAKFYISQPGGIKYFDSLEKPCFLEVWGDAINSEIVTTTTEASAFGEDRVVETTFSRKENVITGASSEPKELTEELSEAIKEGRTKYEIAISTLIEKNVDGGKPKSGFDSKPGASSENASGKAGKYDF